MKFLAIFLTAILAPALASHVVTLGLIGPSEHGIVIQGPGSETALNGPDGSHIAAAVAGGRVVANGAHGGSIAAPVVAAPVLAAAVPLAVGHGAIGVGGWGAGEGHEGQYVHDNSELLYDDGSYRGDHGW